MTNRKATIKNFSGAFVANLFSVIVTTLLVLIVPKFIGIEDYSYWQLYILYVSFVGFMHFGWADGIYLRHGGEYYENLDKKILGTQFTLLALTELIIALLFAAYAILFIDDVDKMFIVAVTGLNCLLMNTRTLLQFILQSTNRILVFSKNLIIEKTLYVIMISSILLLGYTEYEYLVTADLIAKATMLIALLYTCKDIVFSKKARISVGLKEAWKNISVGAKLMFANIAGMLIIGIIRFSIEKGWNIETFGKVSLTLTVANLVMIFISAASVVLFPIIKRSEKTKLPKIYTSLRTLLMVIVLGALLLYYPAYYILTLWLPQYADTLIYMALLFPICVYESKMTMLISTYLKALRKETHILMINIIAVLMSVLVSIVAVYLIRDLMLSLLMMVALVAMRAVIAEIILSKLIDINIKKDIVLEVILSVIFITSSWLIGGVTGMTIYLLAYLVYLFIKKNDITKMIRVIKNS